jgi:prophage regulatory protein
MSIRILRLPDVIRRAGMSCSAIYAHEKNGTFVKRVRLSARSVGWIEAEVEAWIEARPTPRSHHCHTNVPGGGSFV